MSEEVTARDIVGTLMCQGDFFAKYGSFPDAMETYVHAENTLNDAMKENTISSIEEKGLL
jgi:hypothetical protein